MDKLTKRWIEATMLAESLGILDYLQARLKEGK
jgi:hypothetical protein